MSGRIRTIKPDLNEDELVAGLSSAAWRLWISMFTLADDCGTCRASPRYLIGQVFWMRGPELPIDELLDELVRAKRIEIFEVDDERFASIRNFTKHQKIDRPSAPKYPLPPPRESSPDPNNPRRERSSKDREPSRAINDPSPSNPLNGTESLRSTSAREPSLSLRRGLALEGKGEEGKGQEGIARERAEPPCENFSDTPAPDPEPSAVVPIRPTAKGRPPGGVTDWDLEMRGLYVQGIRDIVGAFVWPDGFADQGQLNQAIEEFAKYQGRTPLRGEKLRVWLRAAAGEFAEAVMKNGTADRGFGPRRFAAYLTADAARDRQAAEAKACP